jgi:hypothetical protein
MIRTAIALSLMLTMCGATFAENAPDRSLEEKIVVSPVIVTAKVGDAGAKFKQGDVQYTKVGVVVRQVLRHAPKAPATGATITVWTTAPPKKDSELILFAGRIDKNGYPLRGTLDVKQKDAVKKMLTFEAGSAKALDGKDKLRAAFFRAHQLRPVLLAGAEGKGVKTGAAIKAAEKDKLLATLSWALKESAKKGAKADMKRLAHGLHAILTGPGGLAAIRTRKERAAQFWALALAKADLRGKQKLSTLTLTDQVAAAKVVAGIGIAQPIFLPGRLPQPPTTHPRPTPVPVAVPPQFKTAGAGKPVNGLTLAFLPESRTYDFLKDPKQSVVCKAILKNTGKKALRVNSYMVFPVLTKVYVVDPNGKLTTFTNKAKLNAAVVPAMGTWSFKELKPNSAITATETLPASVFSRNGDYHICAIYKNTFGHQFGIKGVWTGEVVSERITVKVVRKQTTAPTPRPKVTPKPKPVRPPTLGRPIRIQPVRPGAPVPKRPILIQPGVLKQRIRIIGAQGGGKVQHRIIINAQVVEIKIDAAKKADPKKEK